MPATAFQSTFEQIALTQAAISARDAMDKWLKSKAAAVKTDHPAAPDLDKGHSREEVAQNLFETFVKYHRLLFSYASQYNKSREFEGDKGGVQRVFQVDQLASVPKGEPPQDYMANMKQIFVDFVNQNYDERGNLNKELADPEQRDRSIDNAARATHKLYETLKKANNHGAEHFVPLRYLRFPAGLMIAQLGSGEKWKDVNGGKGFDFNRGDKPKPDEDLFERFKQAFNGAADEKNDALFKRENKPSGYIHHHQSFIKIEGHQFLCLKFDDGRTQLITSDGYLVDMTKPLQNHLFEQLKSGIRADKLTIEFDVGSAKHLSQMIQNFLPDEDTPKHQKHAELANASINRLYDRLERMKESDAVDGTVKRKGKATLVSMDVDLLTGLSMLDTKNAQGIAVKSEVARLGAFVKKHSSGLRDDVPEDLVAMSDFLSLFSKPSAVGDVQAEIQARLEHLREIARTDKDADKDMEELIVAATPHILAVAPRIMAGVDEHFAGKKPAAELLRSSEDDKADKMHKKPRFIMTMGGVAAGKSNGEVIADEECGKDNYVIAGLDGVRSMFDTQAINLATDNHNFDYKNVEQPSKLVRALVLERGREQGYHMLLDGSGIPYESRYQPILAAFKGNDKSDYQYKTSVLAFDRTLYVHDPEKRVQLDRESPRKVLGDAFYYQGMRIGRQLRAVPVKIIANNYASVPEALLQASKDPNVDRFWLIDNNPRKKKGNGEGQEESKPYILSFTADITEDELRTLDKLQGAELKQAIIALGETVEGRPERKKIFKAMHHKKYSPSDLPDEGWNFKVVGHVGDRYRVEFISDDKRYLGTMQNGLFNLEANGPEELFRLTKPMSFDAEGLFQNDRHALPIEPVENVAIEDWMRVPYAVRDSLAARKEPCYEISAASPVMRPIGAMGQKMG